MIGLCPMSALAQSDSAADEAVIEHLKDAVPEVATRFEKDSRFFAMVEGRPDPENPNYIRQQYYRVYTGYMMPGHRVVWERFAVKSDLTEILWYNVMKDGYYPLEKWRGQR